MRRLPLIGVSGNDTEMTVVVVILALGFSFLQGLALPLFCIEGLDGIEKLIRIIVDLELIVAILMEFHFLFVKT